MLRSKNPKEFSPQIKPEILEAINSDDPGCGKTFVFSLCRLRHMAAKLREERGEQHKYDPCCYCPKFVTKQVDTPKSETTQIKPEEPEIMPSEPKVKCITPDCPNTTSAHSKTGRCKSCQARVNAIAAREAKKEKSAPKTGAEKTLCNETIQKVTQENSNVTFEPPANTIHAKQSPTPSLICTPDIYARALRHFGQRTQMFKLAEEASELSAATLRLLSPAWNGKDPTLAMIEELADVEIMCQQMRLIFGDKDIDQAKSRKLTRLEHLIEEN